MAHIRPLNTHIPRRQESELAINIKKATSIEEVSPKRMSRRSAEITRPKLTRAQESMSEHALCTHGITRARRASGRA